ncbi:hypothetical protein CASFOL_033839 [Castilleja foliolosa]|uniref:Protein N-terminal asparagine amidohydrolase n=1 Tax=Castilleja foliolosa TaxID=1961234 RepID=A0ABD3BYZ4_9LAMI
MIYVGGVPFAPDDSSQGMDTLIALMELPVLMSASNSFKSMPEKKLSVSEPSSKNRKWVHIFQREFATVDPALVDCGMLSVAHMDSPNIVDAGLTQMLSLVANHDSDDLLDVHLIGAFDDISYQHSHLDKISRMKMKGFSHPLCAKIIETLRNRSEKFQIQTLHVLGHNTRWDSQGVGSFIFHGFVVETSTGSIIPASFDRSSKCPDEIVRRIRITSSYDDPSWTGKLLDTYDTITDHFVIHPCAWSIRQKEMALALQNLSDTEILLNCSSSPSAECPHFVDNLRRDVGLFDPTPRLEKKFSVKAGTCV